MPSVRKLWIGIGSGIALSIGLWLALHGSPDLMSEETTPTEAQAEVGSSKVRQQEIATLNARSDASVPRASPAEEFDTLSVAELAALLLAGRPNSILYGMPQDKIDAVHLEAAKTVHGVLDEESIARELTSLITVEPLGPLAESGAPLTDYDRQILDSIAKDHAARVALHAEQALAALQIDIASKWDAKVGLTVWRDGADAPQTLSPHAGMYRRSVSGGLEDNLHFAFVYSSLNAPEVESNLQSITELKKGLREAQLKYIQSRK